VEVVPRCKAPFRPEDALEDVITELKIRGNVEQKRAIRIVCKHFMEETKEQMLCHITGPGRTGKSHVVCAIVEFFKRCGTFEQLMLSASTGCAAILIDSYTLHALTFLGPRHSYTRPELLERMWKYVKYLVIDEVSMISAHFFNQVSEHLSKAKGWDPSSHEKPFGGVNLVIMGDIGQLPPINAALLFAHTLVDQLSPNITENSTGQGALNGAFWWRQLNKVVVLKKNLHAKNDNPFVNLLSRVCEGRAWNGHKDMSDTQVGTGENYIVSDYENLLSRRLQVLVQNDPKSVIKFKDTPIVVGEKLLQDALNNKIVEGLGGRID
jgi:hypothetical protein